MARAARWRPSWDCRWKKFACSITKDRAPTAIAVTTTWRRPLRCFRKWPAKPVRLQFMRWDEHGWDNYGPSHVGEVRAAASADGKIVGYEYDGWQHHWSNVETTEQLALGKPAEEWRPNPAMQVNPRCCGGMYDIPNVRLVNHHVPGLGYLKGAWLRSPLDLSFSFTSEQAIDQLAFLLKMDPYEFRRSNIKDDRWLGVLDAAAKAANWTPRQAASNLSKAKVVTGRGIGMGTHLASYGAAVAEIEVDKETGKVVAKHLVWRDRCRPGRESRQCREPDQRPVGADCQPDVS